MPLIIVSGYPSSGKTTRSNELKKALEDRIHQNIDNTKDYRVIIINDESLNIEKETYRESKNEKAARGLLYSAVQRELSKSTFVICDALNYIKGFRYQLYCESKSMYTTHCVIHVAVPQDLCRKFNSNKEQPYPDDVLEQLMFRYEEPNGMTRWDSPLFTVLHDDASCPIDDIWSVLIHNKNVKPNQATMVKPPAEVNYLYELDKTTQDVIMLILDNSNDTSLITVPGSKLQIALPSVTVSLPLLQRLRRQFIQINRQQSYNTNVLKEMFVEFLNGQFETLD
ncbi:elongator complex associated protein Kti12 [Schizosaccharomyces pombe]|uniref:Protein kti12 n=1 Tax=Schizosaccharomyces pombe (strain 972 / ATCC 24843) TaxID=284812 RepID=KTI12_SCHPO|nr:putative elongator complex-associated protein Kti2 [Schizosaccharomyces pombe]Q9P7V4.1 RecName: Full=Protein kti12 [Schizosaccharomyces pombe 972h-]CAB66461.1 elongator complex associated protein Kti2 (predicted) [Schizosaccharomyces pombe]|eukprot:NP_594556.1 putative elongator complex-associated protein Kti2 [Schizosaccharomyces pombe]